MGEGSVRQGGGGGGGGEAAEVTAIRDNYVESMVELSKKCQGQLGGCIYMRLGA